MKKFLVLLCLFSIGLGASAEFGDFEPNVGMANFWEKNGKSQQKIIDVGSKVINANKLDKHVSVQMYRNLNMVNAEAHFLDKNVYIYAGILPYIDNDDELAYLVSHEIAHCLDFYDGFFKLVAMKFNSKEYETKADLIGIDMMVKAGYNPIASIIEVNKISGESVFENFIFWSHPKASRRMMNMYKYIYKKYPSYFDSDMTTNVHYQNFTYCCGKQINEFKRNEKLRSKKIEDL